ncbi:MAG: ribonuclease P protein component [Candidatus Woesebacteria bacterium]|jgi:ribonuclease P protein component
MLAKKNRLNLRLQVNSIFFKKAKKIFSPYFTIFYLLEDQKENFDQFAVVIPKKIANKAVLRNKLKRQLYQLIKEFYLKDKALSLENKRKNSLKMILMAKSKLKDLSFEGLRKELFKSLKKIF